MGSDIPLLSSSDNQTTVEGEVITFTCAFQKDYIPLKYHVQWRVKLQNGSTIIVKDDSSMANYHANIKNCSYSNSSCCLFIAELSINAAMPLNNAMINCTATVNGTSSSSSSTSYLSEISSYLYKL